MKNNNAADDDANSLAQRLHYLCANYKLAKSAMLNLAVVAQRIDGKTPEGAREISSILSGIIAIGEMSHVEASDVEASLGK